ncbi:MAG: energy-coupling factor transporter transmembrane component T [Planctomycetaceae bacterium]
MTDPAGWHQIQHPSSLRYSACKLLLAFLLIFVAVLTPLSWWPLWGCLFLVEVGLLIHNPPKLRFWWTRFPYFLFFMISVSVAIPLSQHFQAGWERGMTIFMRGMLAFLATTWLSLVISPLNLIEVLRRAKFPRFLVESLAFMLRYLSLLSTERETLLQARDSRTFNQPGLVSSWKSSAYILAAVLLRALTRAERIYLAMKARGWRGDPS